jgi:tetraprenyl-beta-curcumene synthase
VRSELKRWEKQARHIRDPALQSLALEKLREEHFNAEVAATLAVLAPRRHRRHAVEAIVAFEVMYDYLDGLTEQPATEPLCNGRQLYQSFVDAVIPTHEIRCDYYHYNPHKDDSGYLQQLALTVKTALAQLPSAQVIARVTRDSAIRCAEAQVRVHASQQLARDKVQEWAHSQAQSIGLDWRAYLAGAMASVLCVHALIAASANEHMTIEQGRNLDATYLHISALSTMLDSLTDYQHDTAVGTTWYLDLWQDQQLFGAQLAQVAKQAIQRARALPNGPHHVMTLAGVVAYYTSSPIIDSGHTQPLAARVHRELKPLLTPTLAVMQSWRLAKRLRRYWQHH